MRSFDEILAISADRKGGAAVIFDNLSLPKPTSEIAAIPDDGWLAGMTRGVFQAGFNWQVVESMWSGFEVAFKGFDIGKCAMMDDEWFDQLVTDASIVRHGPKIHAVRDNAVYISNVAKAHGGFGQMVADWPADDFVGLLDHMKKHGARLGGTTGQYLLRSMGVESFILSHDVVARLVAEGVIDKAPTSKSAMAAVQGAFNTWASESGRSLTEISRVLATSIG